MENEENEENENNKKEEEDLEKTIKQQDINQHKQLFITCEDEIKKFGEESKFVNESVEEQGTNNVSDIFMLDF
ncbi:unnamed protein product [Meloidogyne enterolobii]|uniref:Uncharacterized protein n=1 Tax=Meloidogyne enterolobii TaxID=390850 RepID=A0ACB0ZYW1_MELEN